MHACHSTACTCAFNSLQVYVSYGEPQRSREVSGARSADLQRVQACGIRTSMGSAVHVGDVHLRLFSVVSEQ